MNNNYYFDADFADFDIIYHRRNSHGVGRTKRKFVFVFVFFFSITYLKIITCAREWFAATISHCSLHWNRSYWTTWTWRVRLRNRSFFLFCFSSTVDVRKTARSFSEHRFLHQNEKFMIYDNDNNLFEDVTRNVTAAWL